MKAFWIKLLIKLYPAAWRRRYGSEYRTLLEEMALNWQTTFDIIRGGMDAHLHPELTQPGGFTMKQKRIFRLAGAGAILSTMLPISAVLGSEWLGEEASEFLLLISPIALLPVVFALHGLFRTVAPQLSKMAALLGAIGMGTFFLGATLGVLADLLGLSYAPSLWLTGLLQSLIAFIGVWLLLAAYLGWQTHTLPQPLSGLMFVSGVAWFTMLLGIILNSQGNNPLGFWASAALLIWLLAHSIWTLWLGVWLWQRREAPWSPLPSN